MVTTPSVTDVFRSVFLQAWHEDDIHWFAITLDPPTHGDLPDQARFNIFWIWLLEYWSWFSLHTAERIAGCDKASEERIRKGAEALHTTKILDLLLAMTSDPDNMSPNWSSLTIETCPRNMFPDLDDTSAEARMSALVAGSPHLLRRPGFSQFRIKVLRYLYLVSNRSSTRINNVRG
jgi:hypothetical protein